MTYGPGCDEKAGQRKKVVAGPETIVRRHPLGRVEDIAVEHQLQLVFTMLAEIEGRVASRQCDVRGLSHFRSNGARFHEALLDHDVRRLVSKHTVGSSAAGTGGAVAGEE